MKRDLMGVFECVECFLHAMVGPLAADDPPPEPGGPCDECGARFVFIGAFPEHEFFDPYFWIERDRRLGRLVEPEEQ